MINDLQIQAWVEPFSPREIEILGLISEGLSNLEISQKLLLSLETIKWYNKQIFSKLGVKSRMQAVRKAVEYGIFELPLDGMKREWDQSSNLPSQLTSFVGRVREITEIKGLIKTSRLVVLTGTGGCGKSRLALQVAGELVEDFPDGVWLVEFASISDPALVVNAIVRTLEIKASSNVPLTHVLKRFLAHKRLLLLLDNFEHIQEAGPLVTELLAAAPRLTVLATSRERLHLYGEQEYPVPPLCLPDLDSLETHEFKLSENEAVDLFIQRARSTQPGFTVDQEKLRLIARICVVLDGLPLAIELAASQVKIFPLAVLAQRLEKGLDALPSGPNDLHSRQRTLRATFDWSYHLLTENEKILFARLSVFRGGSTLDDIIQVCGHGLQKHVIDQLSSLVEKNLVYSRQDSKSDLRFTMLETIHQFAAERLEASGEAEKMRIMYADYLASMAEDAQKEFYTVRQEYWFARLRDELDNLRSVLSWSLYGSEYDYGLRLFAALSPFWIYNALVVEGWQWADQALIRSSQVRRDLRAGVLRSAGHIASYLNDLGRSKEILDQALELYQQERDEWNAAWTLAYLGGASDESPQEVKQGMEHSKQALELFRKLNDKPGLAYTFNVLGELARSQKDYDAAQRYYEDSLFLSQEMGEIQRAALVFNNLSFVAYHQENYRLAFDSAQQALTVACELQSVFSQSCYLATVGDRPKTGWKPEM